MQFVYDDHNLYLGLTFSWDDIDTLKRGIAQTVRKHGTPSTENICPITEYTNRYGVELFVDPGASQINYYQILFNAAGFVSMARTVFRVVRPRMRPSGAESRARFTSL